MSFIPPREYGINLGRIADALERIADSIEKPVELDVPTKYLYTINRPVPEVDAPSIFTARSAGTE